VSAALSKGMAGFEYLSARLVLSIAALVFALALYVWLDVAQSIVDGSPHRPPVWDPPLEQGPPSVPEGDVFRY